MQAVRASELVRSAQADIHIADFCVVSAKLGTLELPQLLSAFIATRSIRCVHMLLQVQHDSTGGRSRHPGAYGCIVNHMPAKQSEMLQTMQGQRILRAIKTMRWTVAVAVLTSAVTWIATRLLVVYHEGTSARR